MESSELAEACDPFGLGRPTRSRAVGLVRADRAAWRIDTTDKSYFVKSVDVGPEHAAFLAGKDFELAAFAAGLDLPRPLTTRDGGAVLPLGDRVVTVHDWVTGEGVDDDRSEWAGLTLARMAALRPAEEVAGWCYRLPTAAQWAQFANEGHALGEPWADLLERRLPLLERIGRDIQTALTSFGPVAVMHQDIEPHNVIANRARPWLVDWDYSAADSVPLVVAQATLQLSLRGGRPDPDRVRSTIKAYRRAGGAPLGGESGLLVRRLAMLLSRLAERIRTCVGHEPALDVATARSTAHQRLVTLPTFVDELQRWEALFPRD